MSTVERAAVKICQPIVCRCGHVLKESDVRILGDRIDLICSACHADVLRLTVDAQEGYW